MTRTTLILIAFVMATGCGDSANPLAPSPPPEVVPPPIDVRPVDPRFGKQFWQQLVFNQHDNPGVWRPSFVLRHHEPERLHLVRG